MKIQFLVDMFQKGTNGNDADYWEDAETQGDETPEQCANRIADSFNNTLRPGESPRKVVSVRLVEKKSEEESDSLLKVGATWSIELNTTCPHCENYFNVYDSDIFDEYYFVFPEPATSSKEGENPVEVTCPMCDGLFVINLIEF